MTTDNQTDSYSINVVCSNCDYAGEMELPKGTPVGEQMECPTCGCEFATKVPPPNPFSDALTKVPPRPPHHPHPMIPTDPNIRYLMEKLHAQYPSLTNAETGTLATDPRTGEPEETVNPFTEDAKLVAAGSSGGYRRPGALQDFRSEHAMHGHIAENDDMYDINDPARRGE